MANLKKCDTNNKHLINTALGSTEFHELSTEGL